MIRQRVEHVFQVCGRGRLALDDNRNVLIPVAHFIDDRLRAGAARHVAAGADARRIALPGGYRDHGRFP
jgi:hypothetical protein